MNSGMPWLKLPSNKYQQSRVALCSRDARLDYYELYQLAAQCNTDGLFFEDGHQLTVDEIAFKLRRTSKELRLSLKELEDRKLLHVNGKGPQIMDFKNEQINWREKREQTKERVTRYRERVAHDGEKETRHSDGVTLLEEDIKKKIKTYLSSEHQAELSKHPEWIMDAINIATANGKHGEKYFAGILRNWLTEGRKEPQRKPSAKKKPVSKPNQPKLEGDALKAAREKAAKELLGK